MSAVYIDCFLIFFYIAVVMIMMMIMAVVMVLLVLMIFASSLDSRENIVSQSPYTVPQMYRPS